MTDFNIEHSNGAIYHTMSGKTRQQKRCIEKYSAENGKFTRIRSCTTRSSFNPSAPLDGQSLAGSGALVFEGELLNS